VDLRESLSHVLWIGGGPQAGKTTLSRFLAGKWDLRIYNLDWRGVHVLGDRQGPKVTAFKELSMDERWAVPAPSDMAVRDIATWEERFEVVVEELTQLSRERIIVAEGPGAFPWLVAPLISSPRQAIYLVPTPARRDAVAQRRWGSGQIQRFPGIVDRERAVTKVADRDVLIDARIVASCRELGLRCEMVDGSRDLDASLAMIEDQFSPYLPATPNV